MKDRARVVITGVGLTSPLGNKLSEFRLNLLEGKSGIAHTEIRHMGKVAAGLCHFDETKYQSRKNRRRGTRAGSIAIYCANEALADAGLSFSTSSTSTSTSPVDRSRVGIYLGITEHGNVETEQEIHDLYNQNNMDTALWSHHHNPRTVANAPAGEVSLNLNITGPHYTIGAACAAGNLGPIQATQMLQLGEVDMALAGGVSESAATFGIFAAFKSQGALGHHEDPSLATRPLDVQRNGIVVAEGGCIFVMERLEDALKRGAIIYAEVVGYHTNSDASDFVLPNSVRQKECMLLALQKAQITPQQIDIVNMHATGTGQGDVTECEAIRALFDDCANTYINFTKGHIGHAMGAAGALELAGNLPSFSDGYIHGARWIEQVDPKCQLRNLLHGQAKKAQAQYILNNSFGMLGINSVFIVKKYM